MRRLLALSLVLGFVSVAGATLNAEEISIQKDDSTARSSWGYSNYGNGESSRHATYCDSTGYTPMYAKNTGSGYAYVDHHMYKSAHLYFGN